VAIAVRNPSHAIPLRRQTKRFTEALPKLTLMLSSIGQQLFHSSAVTLKKA
jgi:hypothetical protein